MITDRLQGRRDEQAEAHWMRAARRLVALIACLVPALLVSASTAVAGWTDSAAMDTGHNFGVAAQLPGGKVLVAGGNSSSASVDTAEIYDFATDAWSDAAAMGFRNDAAAAELPSGEVLVVGGTAFGTDFKSVRIYDPVADSWSDAADMSTIRVGHAAAQLPGGKVLVMGGVEPGVTFHDSAEIYDAATDSWSAAAPMGAPRASHAAAELPDGRVVVMGGSDDAGVPLASAVIYDPATDSWSDAAPMSLPRFHPTATALVGGRVMVAGGDDGSSAFASTEIYDPATDSWSPGAPMGTMRTFATAAELPGGRMLVAGGTDLGGVAFETTETFALTALGDAYTIREDAGPITFKVRRNDIDYGGGPAQVIAVGDPDNGTAAIADGGNSLTYAPDSDYCNPHGSLPDDTFTYTVEGGDTATVSVRVRCVDDPPTAVDDSYRIIQGTGAKLFPVIRNDTDIDGGAIGVVATTNSANATTAIVDGKVTYDPDPDYCNSPDSLDTFTYTLNGGSEAEVSVRVRCVTF